MTYYVHYNLLQKFNYLINTNIIYAMCTFPKTLCSTTRYIYLISFCQSQCKKPGSAKSHTCEKVGHTPEFVWNLLMDLKINYLLKILLKWANKKL